MAPEKTKEYVWEIVEKISEAAYEQEVPNHIIGRACALIMVYRALEDGLSLAQLEEFIVDTWFSVKKVMESAKEND